ncbi:hypothetical protein ACFL5C_01080 [Candidatus Omnitrophota bacterium]
MNEAEKTKHALKTMSHAVMVIINDYVKVEDYVFKFSLRRVLPIPGFFEKIDYEKCYLTLGRLIEQLSFHESFLEKHMSNFEDEALRNYAETMGDYCIALKSAITLFRAVCYKLYNKGRGSLFYRYPTYNRDLKNYKNAINNYKMSGEKLQRIYEMIFQLDKAV